MKRNVQFGVINSANNMVRWDKENWKYDAKDWINERGREKERGRES